MALSIEERLGTQAAPIENALLQWAAMLRSSVPGIVQSFDPVKQTCTVQVAIQEVVWKPPAGNNPKPGTTQNVPTMETVPLLKDVPIIMARVPGWSITFPITPGTECLLIFADTCIDGWWQSGGVQPPFDIRRHDLSDAFALFGPWSQTHRLSGYSTDSMQIRSDDATVMIELAPGTINVRAGDVNIIAPGVVTIMGSDVSITPLAGGGF